MRRRVLLWVLLISGVVVMIESLSYVAYALISSERFSYASLSERRAMVLAQSIRDDLANRDSSRQNPGVTWSWTFRDSILHPYLGYVRTPPDGRGLETLYDAHTRTTIVEETKATTFVGITGGSVAESMYDHIISSPEFGETLTRIPAFNDTEIEFVPLALRGYKQPQQLLAVTYYLSMGKPLDILINLDGFNEVGLSAELFENGVHPVYPYHWPALTQNPTTLADLSTVGKATLLGEIRYRIATIPDYLHYSMTVQLFWFLTDKLLQGHIARAEHAIGRSDPGLPYFRSGPAFNGERSEFYEWTASLWAGSSVRLYELSANHGFEYFHFFQPSPCLGIKEFSEREKRLFHRTPCRHCADIRAGYPKLKRASETIKARGEIFFDLTTVFESVPGSVYVDECCHFSVEGNTLVSAEIARAVKERLMPPGGEDSIDR